MRTASQLAIAAFLVSSLCSACAFGDRHVRLEYLPPGPGAVAAVLSSAPLAARTIHLGAFTDQHAERSRIGEVRNGWGKHTAAVVAEMASASGCARPCAPGSSGRASKSPSTAPRPAGSSCAARCCAATAVPTRATKGSCSSPASFAVTGKSSVTTPSAARAARRDQLGRHGEGLWRDAGSRPAGSRAPALQQALDLPAHEPESGPVRRAAGAELVHAAPPCSERYLAPARRPESTFATSARADLRSEMMSLGLSRPIESRTAPPCLP